MLTYLCHKQSLPKRSNLLGVSSLQANHICRNQAIHHLVPWMIDLHQNSCIPIERTRTDFHMQMVLLLGIIRMLQQFLMTMRWPIYSSSERERERERIYFDKKLRMRLLSCTVWPVWYWPTKVKLAWILNVGTKKVVLVAFTLVKMQLKVQAR